MPAQFVSYQRFISRQGHSRTRSWLVPEIRVKSQSEIGPGDTQKADSGGRICGSVSGSGEPELGQDVSRLIKHMSREQLAALLILARGLQRDSQDEPFAEE